VEIVVHPVRTTADREAFVRFPEVIYEALPLWVPPLLSEERKRFDRAHHPFFEQGEAEWFLALQDGVVCGRICVAIDARFERSWNLRAAWFGAFECRNQSEVALALFDRAAAWARERGATEMRGPAYFSMNELCGLLVEGFDSPPPLLMPYNPDYYAGLIERAGFLKAKDLVSYRTSQAPGERFARVADRARARGGFSTRGFNPRKYNEDIKLIQALYNQSWRDNWGAVPMTDREMAVLAAEIRPFADFELMRFAFAGDRPVALCLSIPDINPILKKLNGHMGLSGLVRFLWERRRVKGVRTILFGVIPEFRGRGLDVVLTTESVQIGLSRGYTSVEMGWTLEDNDLINGYLAELGALSRRFRIYRRSL
jgi:hypothetical protein